MGIEIERKFLVKDDSYKNCGKGTLYIQGYLSADPNRVVRVRIAGEKGYITVKSKVTGIRRQEYEYEIPVSDAHEMLQFLCDKPLIEKHRYLCEYNGFFWEIDEFQGENQGLVIAEIELQSEDATFDKPEWAGDEVTGIKKYYNSQLISNPYKYWD